MKHPYPAVRFCFFLLAGLLPRLASAATPLLRLEATVAASATDVTAFVDKVEILDATTGLPVAGAVSNASFETSGSLSNTTYGYNPGGASWNFVSNSGIASNGSAFNSPTAPEGTRVAFLQTISSGAGYFSQTLPSLAPGLYRVRLRAAQRNTSPANQGVRVLVDGVTVGTFTPANNGAFATYYSATFAVARPSTSGIFPGGSTLISGSSNYVVPAVTDVDGDGLLDLLVSNDAGNVLRYEQSTANGATFTSLGNLTTNGSTAISTGSATLAALAMTDLDGDGLLDLLVSEQGGSVVRYEQPTTNAATFALVGPLLTVGPNPRMAVTDLDGDGLLDLLAGNGNGNVERYEQTTANAAALTLVGTLTTDGSTALDVGFFADPAVTDVDGDGLLDLLVGNSNGNVVRYEQTTVNGGVFALVGTGTLTTNGSTALDVDIYAAPAVTDVDGDGLLDLLVGNAYGNVLRYEQADPPTALALTPQTVVENAASGTAVGTFTTTTATNQSTFTYSLVSGTGSTDNASFAIGTGANAGKLVTAAVFDYETKSSYSIRVRTTDATGLSVDQTFTISVTDVLEAPALSGLTPGSGPTGTTLTLTGSDLTGLSSVLLGESPALFTVNSSSSVTLTVPRGATSQKVRVTRTSGAAGQGTALSPTAFTVTRPSTSSIFPGGTTLSGLIVSRNVVPAVTDLDGDGLLDLLVANYSGTVARYEQTTANGTAFTSLGNLTTNGSTAISVGSYASVAVTDVDGDGLLDLLVGRFSGTIQRYEQTAANAATFASVGTLTTDGTFDLDEGTSPRMTFTDVDRDGLLDLLIGNIDGKVLRYEQTTTNGSIFALVGPITTNGTTALDVDFDAAPAVTDLDGDGLLDLLVGNYDGNVLRYEQTTASGGVFAPVGSLTTNGSTAIRTGAGSAGSHASVAVTDLDGDGLLDLLVGNEAGYVLRYEQADPPTALALSPQTVAENAAAGTVVGTFSTTDATSGDTFTYSLVSGTGSTDNASFAIGTGANAGKLVTAAVFDYETKSSYSVRVRTTDATDIYYEQSFTISVTNEVELPTLSSLSPSAELPGQTVTITGTGFISASTVSFGGVAATSVTFTSATSLTATVPTGASAGSSAVVVSNAEGSSTSSPAFTVLSVYDGGSVGACAAALPATATVADGLWHYLLSSSGQVVAAYNYSGTNLGSFSAEVLQANPASAVRQDGYGRRYLDRNLHLSASGGTFAGRTVSLRLYGLNSELSRLQAVDAAATLTNLKVTQYSGSNEDCSLANDDFSGGELRTLTATASSPSGASWFVSELAVPDHFSEFFLTSSASPLPVELSAFTATAEGPAARLRWSTASEKNNAHFDIERSLDGQEFERIGEVKGQGSTASRTDYTYLDDKLTTSPLHHLTYYRLKQVDTDGSTSYSPVRTVTFDNSPTHQLTISPNPARGSVTLRGAVPGASVQVLDALGRLVGGATADAQGEARLALPPGLPVGVYLMRSGQQTRRLAVE